MDSKEIIKKMVDRADEFLKKGNNNAALQALREAWNETEYLPAGMAALKVRGLIYHYQGRVEQAMGRYSDAVVSLEYAAGFRKDDTIQLAYTWFEMFICKVSGNIPISDEEEEATKMALLKAMADDTASDEDVGNMMQNVAYIKQVKGSLKKAILFYKMTLNVRRQAGDKRGEALTEARLAEVYWKGENRGDASIAITYGDRALEYFKRTGDVERVKQVEDIFGRE